MGQDADGFEQFHSKFFRIKFLKLDIQCAIIDTAHRLSFTVYFLMFLISIKRNSFLDQNFVLNGIQNWAVNECLSIRTPRTAHRNILSDSLNIE